MTRRNLLAAMVLTTLASACAPRKERVRYRMTVVVDTPEGPRTGAAVRESIYRYPPYIPFALGEDRGSVKVRGEAVAVDLPNGRTIYVLLSEIGGGQDFAARVPDRFLGHGKGRAPVEVARVWPIEHPNAGMPNIVTFADPSDFKTIQPLRPASFEEVLGLGYRLSSITVERTDDPVTTGLAERVPSFGTTEEYFKWRSSLDDAAKAVVRSDFVKANRNG